jgi:hypothetical protein
MGLARSGNRRGTSPDRWAARTGEPLSDVQHVQVTGMIQTAIRGTAILLATATFAAAELMEIRVITRCITRLFGLRADGLSHETPQGDNSRNNGHTQCRGEGANDNLGNNAKDTGYLSPCNVLRADCLSEILRPP